MINIFYQFEFNLKKKTNFFSNRSEYVAKNLMTVIKEAKSGSIWMITNGKSLKEVPYSSVA